jgi:hypothetical protein
VEFFKSCQLRVQPEVTPNTALTDGDLQIMAVMVIMAKVVDYHSRRFGYCDGDHIGSNINDVDDYGVMRW